MVEGSNSNGGSGNNLSLPSNNNSIVTSTVTTTSAGGNSMYYQTVSSMVFIPSPPEQYTNAGSNTGQFLISLSASDSFLVLFVGVVLNLFSTQIFSQVQNVSMSNGILWQKWEKLFTCLRTESSECFILF